MNYSHHMIDQSGKYWNNPPNVTFYESCIKHFGRISATVVMFYYNPSSMSQEPLCSSTLSRLSTFCSLFLSRGLNTERLQLRAGRWVDSANRSCKKQAIRRENPSGPGSLCSSSSSTALNVTKELGASGCFCDRKAGVKSLRIKSNYSNRRVCLVAAAGRRSLGFLKTGKRFPSNKNSFHNEFVPHYERDSVPQQMVVIHTSILPRWEKKKHPVFFSKKATGQTSLLSVCKFGFGETFYSSWSWISSISPDQKHFVQYWKKDDVHFMKLSN